MDTTITLSVQQILIWALILVGIIAVIYIIVLLSRAIKLLKPTMDAVDKLNLVLDDVKSITGNVKDGSDKAKKALDSASTSLVSVARIIDANKGPISAVTSLLGASASLASLLGVTRKRRTKLAKANKDK